MAEYIEREAALEAIRNLYPGIPFTKRLMQKWHEENKNFMQCESAIERLPAADVVPVRHGRWIEYPECLRFENAYSDDHIVCSECHEVFSILDNCTEAFNYCPNCGAKMDGEA